jgi:hypothetical protein
MPEQEIKTCCFRENPEIEVARKERNAFVNTALGDERVAEASPAPQR